MNTRQAMVCRVLLRCSLAALLGCASNFAALSAELKLLLPLNRTAVLWSGHQLLIGDADGRLAAFSP